MDRRLNFKNKLLLDTSEIDEPDLKPIKDAWTKAFEFLFLSSLFRTMKTHSGGDPGFDYYAG